MKTSVILSTYNQPEWLEKSLWGFATQTRSDFEIVIADDGSGPQTRAAIARLRHETGLDIHHVWHSDRGFRKCEILNRAIVAAGGDYLIFVDGDCVPVPGFVETHVSLAEPERFLSGGAIALPLWLSQRISVDDIRERRLANPTWLLAQGWWPGRKLVLLPVPALISTALDRGVRTPPTWNGHNASAWRDSLLEVNGFDHEMGYGHEDRAMGERLEHAGVSGKLVRHRAVCFHLEHDRPYVNADVQERNKEILRRISVHREKRTRVGIAELEVEAEGDGE